MTTNTVVGWTAATPVVEWAWSQCDDEPLLVDCPDWLYSRDPNVDPVEAAVGGVSWWFAWVFAAAAWVAGATALAVMVGWAYVAFTPVQPSTPQPPTSTYPTSDGITPGGDFIPE